MKISVFGLLLRVTIIGLIIFSIYLLLIQFIFSYFNQSTYGPKLTFSNFAGPFLMTVLVLFFSGINFLFKNVLTNKIPLNPIVANILTILLFALIAWQTWYIVTLYKMDKTLDSGSKLTELMPMTLGALATLFFVTKIARRKHAS